MPWKVIFSSSMLVLSQIDPVNEKNGSWHLVWVFCLCTACIFFDLTSQTTWFLLSCKISLLEVLSSFFKDNLSIPSGFISTKYFTVSHTLLICGLMSATKTPNKQTPNQQYKCFFPADTPFLHCNDIPLLHQEVSAGPVPILSWCCTHPTELSQGNVKTVCPPLSHNICNYHLCNFPQNRQIHLLFHIDMNHEFWKAFPSKICTLSIVLLAIISTVSSLQSLCCSLANCKWLSKSWLYLLWPPTL